MSGVITRGKVIRGDLAQWDGKTSTYSRLDATGGTVTGLAVGNEVDVLQVFGSGTDRTLATILSATRHINTTTVTLVLAPGTWTIDDDLTIASNFTVRLPTGCVLNVSSGKTLTFNGPVLAEGATHTSGSGTVIGLDNSSVRNAFYRIIAAETTAGVTPTNYAYPPLDVRRYGASSAASAATNVTAINNASLVANTAGGGIVYIPAGTYSINGTLLFYASPNLGQTIFRGDGKVATTLSYTGAAAGFGVSAANTRIYDCGIEDLTVTNAGTGTIGLDLDSVSTSFFAHVTISNFDTAVKLHSTINGGCVYTRFYDVTAQMDASPTIGFHVDALGSNATHFTSCRYNGPSNAIGTAWKIVDAIGCSVISCDIDQALVGYDLTAPSGAGNTDSNVFTGNRNENIATVYSLGANVRYTQIAHNSYISITTLISDSGTRNNIWDPPYNSYEKYAGTASSSGHKRFENTIDQGANPFLVIADNSSTSGAIALQVENTSSAGVLVKGAVSGTEKFSLDSTGKLNIQTVVLKAVAPTVAASQVGLGSTTQTTVGAAGGASALPATPTGYLIVNIAGTNRVIPFYAAA